LTTLLYQYEFERVDPEVKFIFNTDSCLLLKVAGELDYVGFCTADKKSALQLIFTIDAFHKCKKNGGVIQSIDPNDMDALLKFNKKVKALPRPCKPGMKGCPDISGNPVKPPAPARRRRR